MASPPVEIFFGDGTTFEFQYVFEVLGNFSAVLVKTRPMVDENFSQLTLGLEYEHNLSTKTISFNTGFIPEGDGTPEESTIIRIERFTNRDRQIDYVGGSTIEERNLDNDPNRLTMVDQEIEASLFNALRKNDALDAWNGENLPSENCAFAVEQDGWVTLQQMEDFISGGQSVDVTGASVYAFVGDGSEVQFRLAGLAGLTTGMLDAYIEAVYQSSNGSAFFVLHEADAGHPGGNVDDYIEFLTPPPDGSMIEVKVLNGTIHAPPADFSIDTQHLADDAVTLSKINIGPGLDTRFLVCDGDGDPVGRRIGGADLLALTADENGSLANDFSALIRTLRLDQFADPTSLMNFGGVRVEDLGSGTGGTTDACNVEQMENHVTTEIQNLDAVSLQLAKGIISVNDWSTKIDGQGGGGIDPNGVFTQMSFQPQIIWLRLYNFSVSRGGNSVVFLFFPRLPEHDDTWLTMSCIGEAGAGISDIERWDLDFKIGLPDNGFSIRNPIFQPGTAHHQTVDTGSIINFLAIKL